MEFLTQIISIFIGVILAFAIGGAISAFFSASFIPDWTKGIILMATIVCIIGAIIYTIFSPPLYYPGDGFVPDDVMQHYGEPGALP